MVKIIDPDFEQFHTYQTLPNTGAELNLRQAYDLTAKTIRDYKTREVAADQLALLVKEKITQLNVPTLPTNNDTSEQIKALKKEGVVQLPNILNHKQISDIYTYIENEPITDFYKPELKFNLNSIPEKTRIGRYRSEFNINCPHIFDALNHSKVLRIVEGFLGAPPTLSVAMFMWSFANAESAQYMQLFHRDNDDYRFCKLFIYLTDVEDQDDGPHLFIKNSIDQEIVQAKLDKLDISTYEKETMLHHVFAGHPHHRYDEQIVHKTFPEQDRLYHLGKKGTSFIENTWGIHRGLPPRRKHRLLLQAQYSLQPTPMFSYTPHILKQKNAFPDNRYNQYVNRLYVKL